MRTSSTVANVARWALVPVLAATIGLTAAYGQDHGNHGHDNHGHDHYDNGHGHAYGRESRGGDFHFHGDERARFAPHYSRDVEHWRRYPRSRPRFYAGYYIPRTYVIQPVPPAYCVGMPPPPPGYGYGYYGGYVVAYNPTTRIVADAIDLVGTAIAAH